MCLEAVQTKFPKSSRVARLKGMDLEQKGEYSKAETIYDAVLKENSANALIMKRKIAILIAQKKNMEAVQSLNEFLKHFQTDQAAVSWKMKDIGSTVD